MQSILLEEMTSPAVGAAIESGWTTAVVACGAVEQHGPHLPLFMDAEHGSELAAQIARRLGKALVAPTIRVGCSEHHMKFAGTISLRTETFEAMCMDYAVSLARHGFRDICFVPSHGGNYAPLARALPAINATIARAARAHAFLDLLAQIDVWRQAVQAESALGQRVGGHADIAESSIMLALHPDLVHEADAAEGYMGELTQDDITRMIREGIGTLTSNGILGDARGMSVAIGRRCIDATADRMADHFRMSIAQQPSSADGIEAERED